MKKGLLILSIVFVTSITYAQKRYYVTNQYLYDLYLMNPAGAGYYKGCHVFSGYYQKKWFGFDDAPATQVLSYQGPLTESLGLGTYFYNDGNGFYNKLGLQASLSYELTLSKQRKRKSTLTFGMSASAEQSSVDQTQLVDGAIIDPALSGANESGWGFNSNAGLLFKYNEYHIGFSAINLLPQNNPMYTHVNEPELTTDFHIHAGTTFKIPDRDIFLEPFVMYRRNMQVDSKLDVSMKGYFPTPDPNLSFWGLVSYQHTTEHNFGKSLGLTTAGGVQFNNVIVGIEYQAGLTGAQLDYGSAYQIICKYRICRDKSKDSIPCTEKQRWKRNKAVKKLKLKM